MIENASQTDSPGPDSHESAGGGTVRRRRTRRWVAAAVAAAAVAWLVLEVFFPPPPGPSRQRIIDGSYYDPQESADGDTTASGFPTELIDDVQAMFPTVARSTVKIVSDGGGGHGTGWILDDRHVLTNWHVVFTACEAACTMLTYDGATLSGTVLGTEEFDDIAVIRLSDPTDLPAIPLAASPEPVGAPVFFVGHPGVMGDWVLGIGVFTAEVHDFVMTTLPTAEGSSGSALLNASGEAIGLISGCMYAGAPPEQNRKKDVPAVYSVVPEKPAGQCGGTNIERTMEFVNSVVVPSS